MHVVYLVYSYAPDLRSPEELLERYTTIRAWARAMTLAGAKVTVVQRFSRDATRHLQGAEYRFVGDTCSPQLRAWEYPRRCDQALLSLLQDDSVVHFNGMLFPLQLRALRARLPRAVPIVVQHHAERPWLGVRQLVQRMGLAGADAFLFAAADLALSWSAVRLITPAQPVYEVMESAITLRPRDKRQARARTGIGGDPAVLWVGNLIPRKAPLTILDGFERIVARIPGARLYMVYRETLLLPDVRARIGYSEVLRRSVVLLGPVDHAAMESVYNSADYFVLGSRYEGSGYALAEAMACGVVPIVTGIPPFRAMLGAEEGGLWRVDDAADFADTFLRALRRPLTVESARILARFEQHLSPYAVGRKALAAYDEARRRRMAAA